MLKVDLGATNGKNGGIISGIDTKTMIKEAVEKKKAPIILEEKAIDFNNDKISALTQFNSLVSGFQSSLIGLKGLKLTEDGQDLFQTKLVNLSSSATNSPQNYIAVDVTNAPLANNFSIVVKQLALNQILQTSSFTSNNLSVTNPAIGNHDDPNLFTPGIFQLNQNSITIDENDSLNIIATKINASHSNVSAQVISPQFNKYVILLQANNTGSENSIIINDPDNVLNDILSAPNSVLQAAQNSIISYNNIIDVERPSNQISDLLQGVTINLLSPTTSQNSSFSININISTDTISIAQGIQNFIDNYNLIVEFATAQQKRVSGGKYDPEAKIQRDETVSTLMNKITTLARQLISVKGSSINTGISLKGDSMADIVLIVDNTLLKNALVQNPDYVRKLFVLDVNSDSNSIILQSNGNNITSGNIRLDIDVNRANVVQAYVNDVAVAANFSPLNTESPNVNGIISAESGSLLDKYKFYYSGADSEIINITISQGIADKIYNIIQDLLIVSPINGQTTLNQSINYLMNDNRNKRIRIEQQTKKLEEYENKLEDKYSKMEIGLAKSNAILNVLDAQSKAMNKG